MGTRAKRVVGEEHELQARENSMQRGIGMIIGV
jgi:hypothetical protein